VLTTAIVDNGL